MGESQECQLDDLVNKITQNINEIDILNSYNNINELLKITVDLDGNNNIASEEILGCLLEIEKLSKQLKMQLEKEWESEVLNQIVLKLSSHIKMCIQHKNKISVD